MNYQGDQSNKIRKPYALAVLWLLCGAHCMLELLFLSSKTIVETTQQRIAIHPNLIITVLPIFKPTDAK